MEREPTHFVRSDDSLQLRQMAWGGDLILSGQASVGGFQARQKFPQHSVAQEVHGGGS